MPRYVMMRSANDPNKDALTQVCNKLDIEVVDHISNKAILINATEQVITRARLEYPTLIIHEEQKYRLL